MDGENSGNDIETGGSGTPDGGAVERYTPEGFPEHLLGDDDHGTIDRLFTAYSGARERLAQAGDVPKDVAGYVYEPNETLAPFFADESDPVLASAKQAALKTGITGQQFQSFIDETFTELVGSGQIEAPYDPARELKNLGTYLDTKDPREIEKIATDNEAFVKNLAAQMELPEPVAGFMASLTDLAGGNVILHRLSGLLQERGISLGAEGETGKVAAISEDELRALDADERIDPASPKFDPALRKKYDEAYQKLYG